MMFGKQNRNKITSIKAMKYVSEMENVCNRRKVYWLADGCADMGIQFLNPHIGPTLGRR